MIHHWLCSVIGYKITVLKMDVVIFAFGVRYAQEVGFMIGFVQLPTGYKTMAKFYFIVSTLLATSVDDIVWLPWGKFPNNYYTLLFQKRTDFAE
jgi:hypothetical protein